jgi:citrate lyase subunit beta/citryl-CoA lyase
MAIAEMPVTDLMPRPRRSALYVPGDKPRALEKAGTTEADVIIADLEDAVAPEAKAEARAGIAALIGRGGYPGKQLVVRINGLDTAEAALDLVAAAGADAVLVPKVDGPEDIRRAEAGLHALVGEQARPQLWAMIETPRAILNLGTIAAEGARSGGRLAALVLGTNDLVKETGVQMTASRMALLSWLSAAVIAGRAYGLTVLDGVFNGLGDADGLAAECRHGRTLGFDGKTLIHPEQVAAANAAFGPSDQEIAEAQAIVAAFALPENAGRGVIRVGGRMTERLHLAMAEKLLAMARLIGRL